MSLPKPPTSSVLDNSCAIIHDNKLYSYSPEGFVSLRLEEGGEWEVLAGGESVTGAACVGSAAAFYVVGGNGGSAEYFGLQKYDYGSGKWSSITPPGGNQVLKNRRWHGATYIAASDKIVVYAGTVTGVQGHSEETFAVAASNPYTIESFSSAGAPTGVKPILLPWEGSDAVMVGGDPKNTQIWLFNTNVGWRNFGATLASPVLSDAATQGAALVTGTDGSKHLLVFNMATSPNTVTRVVLKDGKGQPVKNSAAIGKRELAQDKWPSYNDTLAPTSTRSNFALAQGANGKIVLSGGNAQEPLSIFDMNKNSWVDPKDVLLTLAATTTTSSSSTSRSSTTTLRPSSTRSSTTSHTTTHSRTTTSASTLGSTSAPTSSLLSIAAISVTTSGLVATSTGTVTSLGSEDTKHGKKSGLSSMAVMGITLGTIFGFILILAAILFCIRRHKKRQYQSETPINEKDPNAFPIAANKSSPSPTHFRGHQIQPSADSFSSMAILMGPKKSGRPRKGSVDTLESSSSLAKQQLKSTISKPVPLLEGHPAFASDGEKGLDVSHSAMEPVPRPRNLTKDLAPDDPTRRSSGWNKYWSGGSALQILGFGGSKRHTSVSDQSSRYSQSTGVMPQHSRATQDSATVPPLKIEGRPQVQVSNVNSGSPVVSEGFPRDGSLNEAMTGKIERSTSRASSSGYSSGVPESVYEVWDPVSRSKPWGSDRAPSSTYSSSIIHFGAPLGAGKSGARMPPPASGVSLQPQLSVASQSNDMSWLDLGDQAQDKSRLR